MKLQVFQDIYSPSSENELRKLLKQRHEDIYGAFWLIEEEPTMALFINREKAVLYFRPLDGEDIWATNPDLDDSETSIGFLIENYQLDDFPLEMVIDADKAVEAFVQYFKKGELQSSIHWG